MTTIYQVEKMNKRGKWDASHSLGPYFDLEVAEGVYVTQLQKTKCKKIRLVGYYDHATVTIAEKDVVL